MGEDAPERGEADLLVKGEGGDVFAMDVPEEPARREVFDDMVRKGLLVILEGEVPTDEPAPVPDDDKSDAAGDGEPSLEDHTVVELRDIAEAEGVDLDGLHLKADIVDAIEAGRAEDD